PPYPKHIAAAMPIITDCCLAAAAPRVRALCGPDCHKRFSTARLSLTLRTEMETSTHDGPRTTLLAFRQTLFPTCAASLRSRHFSPDTVHPSTYPAYTGRNVPLSASCIAAPHGCIAIDRSSRARADSEDLTPPLTSDSILVFPARFY